MTPLARQQLAANGVVGARRRIVEMGACNLSVERARGRGMHRTISLAAAVLLTFVTSARGAGLLPYETCAPDLGTASAGRAAMAADASTAAANPAGMTLLDRSQLLGSSGAMLPSTNFDIAPQTTTSGGGGGNAGVFLPI